MFSAAKRFGVMIAYLLESARSAAIGRRPADISYLGHGDDFGGFDDLGNLEGSRLRSAEMRRRSASQARLSMRGFVVARQAIAKLERLKGVQVELNWFAGGEWDCRPRCRARAWDRCRLCR